MRAAPAKLIRSCIGVYCRRLHPPEDPVRGRDLLTIAELTADEVETILQTALSLKHDGGGARLWLTTSAEACGRQSAETFAEQTFCERSIDWNDAAQRFDYAPIDTIRLIE